MALKGPSKRNEEEKNLEPAQMPNRLCELPLLVGKRGGSSGASARSLEGSEQLKRMERTSQSC